MPLSQNQKDTAAPKAKALRDAFIGKRIRKPNQTPLVALTVSNWDAIELLMLEPPTMESNPGGPDFEHIIIDAQAAIEAQDAQKLIDNMLLMLKAVRRV